MIKPITPGDVIKVKNDSIPDNVIEAFNEEIISNWNGHESIVYQVHVVNRIVNKMFSIEGFNRADIFDRRWLDIEYIFRDEGWNVTFDKDDYGGGNNCWTFSRE